MKGIIMCNNNHDATDFDVPEDILFEDTTKPDENGIPEEYFNSGEPAATKPNKNKLAQRRKRGVFARRRRVNPGPKCPCSQDERHRILEKATGREIQEALFEDPMEEQ